MQYEWNPDKNAELKKERNISFEEIVFHLSRGDLWKTADHPDQEKYPGQKLYFVLVDDYIYIVPHVVSKEHIFLKTINSEQKSNQAVQGRKGEAEMKYDEEEKLILDALEKDGIQLSDQSKDELKAVRTAAKRTFKKNQRVTIRLYDHDFEGIQKKALEMGIPYQTLISVIIHRYVEGDIKIKIKPA